MAPELSTWSGMACAWEADSSVYCGDAVMYGRSGDDGCGVAREKTRAGRVGPLLVVQVPVLL